MKRFVCICACLLLVAAALPLTAYAEAPAVTAVYQEGVLQLTWADTEASLSRITDANGTSYTPRVSETGSAEVELTLEPGEYSFSASFTTVEGEVVSTFTVTVPETTTPPPTFTVTGLQWDETTLTVTVNWAVVEGMTVRVIRAGGVEAMADDTDGEFTATLFGLPYGQHTVEYVVDYNGEELTFTDAYHVLTYVGGRVETSLTVEEQDGTVWVYVMDTYQRPIEGVTVHLEAGSTGFNAVTDENGCASFPVSLADTTRIYSDELDLGDTQYVGSEYAGLTPPTTPETTTPTTEEVVSTTTKRSTTTRRKRTTATTLATTTTTVGYATHAGAGTTGVEDAYVSLNVLSDEKILESMQLSASALDNGARLLVEPTVYEQLVAESEDTAIMLSVLNTDRTITTNQAKAILSENLKGYDTSSIRTVTMDLGLIYWDLKTQTGMVQNDLPEGSYVVRLPLPKIMEECNRVYVVDMSGDEPGEHIEANADTEFVQFTLNGLGPVALVACQGEDDGAVKYVHPVVYVFFAVGGLLLLLTGVMIYFFFIRKGNTPLLEEENVAEDAALADAEVTDPSENEENGEGVFVDPEEDISLGDFLRRRPHDTDKD